MVDHIKTQRRQNMSDKVLCSHCSGSGEVWENTKEQYYNVIIIDKIKSRCQKCKGLGRCDWVTNAVGLIKKRKISE